MEAVAPDMKMARRWRRNSRARCARDFAAGTVIPKDPATSAIDKPSTSRRMITAR